MAETIPVSLKKGHIWRFDKSLGILIEMVYGISKSGWRIVHHAVSKRLRLDSRSRAEDDNLWTQKQQEEEGTQGKEEQGKEAQEKEVKICSLRRGNKGLAMELTISSMLTYLDHPEAVQCNCSTSASGLPNKAAGGGEPDIVYRPRGSSDYQVVCEVSAKQEHERPRLSSATGQRSPSCGGRAHVRQGQGHLRADDQPAGSRQRREGP